MPQYRTARAMCTKDIALKAACADNFYYPPEWDPNSGKDLDKFQREQGFQHHLGAHRVKNLNKGVLLIRFEVPFKVRCLRCQGVIEQGTRYDADKKCVGKYYSTKIWSFTMRCKKIVGHEKSADGRIYCNQQFVWKTDPENRDYELAEGLEKVNHECDQTSSAGQHVIVEAQQERRDMEADPMFKLEKTIRDKEKEAHDKERLRALMLERKNQKDAYAVNSDLRKRLRTAKKEDAEQQKVEDARSKNFMFPLLDETEDDREEAESVAFKTDYNAMKRIQKQTSALNQPLFSRTQRPTPAAEVQASAASTKASTTASLSKRSLGSRASEKAKKRAASEHVENLVQKRQKTVMHQKMERLRKE